MLFTSKELIDQFQDYYVRHGIDISSVKEGHGWSDRQFAHWPIPRCLGGADDQGVDLLKLHHVLLDLVVSEEVQHPSFFLGDAKTALRRLPDELDSETSMFFHWLYEKWAGENLRGKRQFKGPKGEIAWLSQEEVPTGWVPGVSNLTRLVVCPHCGRTMGVANAKRWHFDRCPHAGEQGVEYRKTTNGWRRRPAVFIHLDTLQTTFLRSFQDAKETLGLSNPHLGGQVLNGSRTHIGNYTLLTLTDFLCISECELEDYLQHCRIARLIAKGGHGHLYRENV